eukprot:COSAG06_NODE_1488_length_9290_cov_4.140899_7_plen_187_part_00
MVLLALELTGNAATSPSVTYTLQRAVRYSKATLRAVDLHAPSPGLSHSWTAAQTGDGGYPSNRTAYAPLYVDIEGIMDDGQVELYTSHTDDGDHTRRLLPIGDAKSENHSLRAVNLPLASAIEDGAALELAAGHQITATLYYRSMEAGTVSNVEPVPANVVAGDGGIESYGAWTNDSRLTLYVELE